MVENIREDKGRTYSPRSGIEHGSAGSTLVAEADVATKVTVPALLELWYELGRMSTLRPSDEELKNACQFASGTPAMSVATMAGLATTLVNLAAVGLDLTWVREHRRRLAEVTAQAIYDLGVPANPSGQDHAVPEVSRWPARTHRRFDRRFQVTGPGVTSKRYRVTGPTSIIRPPDSSRAFGSSRPDMPLPRTTCRRPAGTGTAGTRVADRM
jgi:hypothetical protein